MKKPSMKLFRTLAISLRAGDGFSTESLSLSMPARPSPKPRSGLGISLCGERQKSTRPRARLDRDWTPPPKGLAHQEKTSQSTGRQHPDRPKQQGTFENKEPEGLWTSRCPTAACGPDPSPAKAGLVNVNVGRRTARRSGDPYGLRLLQVPILQKVLLRGKRPDRDSLADLQDLPPPGPGPSGCQVDPSLQNSLLFGASK